MRFLYKFTTRSPKRGGIARDAELTVKFFTLSAEMAERVKHQFFKKIWHKKNVANPVCAAIYRKYHLSKAHNVI
jgi:hypothetical protein